jgi:hypothetical protein
VSSCAKLLAKVASRSDQSLRVRKRQHASESRQCRVSAMPRPKVTNRKRILTACANCKRRKEKCDGLQPCGRCKYRARELECNFLDTNSSTSTRHASTAASRSREGSLEPAGSRTFRESRQDVTNHAVPHGTAKSSNSATSAPVQELSRFLQDPKGKFSESIFYVKPDIRSLVDLYQFISEILPRFRFSRL